jgi:hypothetical protein
MNCEIYSARACKCTGVCDYPNETGAGNDDPDNVTIARLEAEMADLKAEVKRWKYEARVYKKEADALRAKHENLKKAMGL